MRLPLVVLSIALAFAGLGNVANAGGSPVLVDQTGRSFTLASLQGRPLAITFVSAHCTDACPLIDGQFADAASHIAGARFAAQLVTITLDPQHDPPSLMRALARRFDADPHYWLVAGGKPADVEAVLREFGVVTQTGKDGYREAHTTFVYVFDKNGRLARTLMASNHLNEDVVEALRSASAASR